MEITLAKPEDIEAILKLQTQIYRVQEIAPSAKEVLEKQIQQGSCDILVLKEEDKIIGTAAIHYADVPVRARPFALLEGLVVDENHRGKGYGKALFKKCVEIAKDKNCYKMLFTSGFDRDEAHQFYEKLGFKKWGFEFRMDL